MISKLYIYIPVTFFFLLVFVFQNPSVIKTTVVYLIIFVLTFFTGIFLLKDQKLKHWRFLSEICVFVLSGLLFFLFLVNEFWRYFFIIIFCLFFSIFIKYIYNFFYQIRLYTPYGLEKLSPIFNFIISYWVLTGMSALIGWDPFWWPSLLSFGLAFILYLWLIRDLTSVGFASSLVLAELYLVVKFLPLGIYFNALIVSIAYVIMIMYIKNSNYKIKSEFIKE